MLSKKVIYIHYVTNYNLKINPYICRMIAIYTQMVLYNSGQQQTKKIAIAGNIQLPSIEVEQKQIV